LVLLVRFLGGDSVAGTRSGVGSRGGVLRFLEDRTGRLEVLSEDGGWPATGLDEPADSLAEERVVLEDMRLLQTSDVVKLDPLRENERPKRKIGVELNDRTALGSPYPKQQRIDNDRSDEMMESTLQKQAT
jgi:hypothetical protein